MQYRQTCTYTYTVGILYCTLGHFWSCMLGCYGLASSVAVIVLDTVHLAPCNYACTVNYYILNLINPARTNVWYICTYTSVSNVQTTNALYTQYRGERGGGNSLQQATLHPCHRHHRHPAQTDRQTDTNTTVCTNDPPPADHPLVGHTWLRL